MSNVNNLNGIPNFGYGWPEEEEIKEEGKEEVKEEVTEEVAEEPPKKKKK